MAKVELCRACSNLQSLGNTNVRHAIQQYTICALTKVWMCTALCDMVVNGTVLFSNDTALVSEVDLHMFPCTELIYGAVKLTLPQSVHVSATTLNEPARVQWCQKTYQLITSSHISYVFTTSTRGSSSDVHLPINWQK